MKEVSIYDDNYLEHILAFFQRDQAVLLEFPNVYGLIAPSNTKGVESLNWIKKDLKI